MTVFSNFIASSALDWYLTHYAKNHAQMEWKVERIIVTSDRIRLIKPQLTRQEDDCAFHAEAIDITYAIHPFEWTIDLKCQFDTPILALTPDADFSFVGSIVESDNTFFYFKSSINVTKGIIAFHDDSHPTPSVIHYNCFYDNFEGTKGKLEAAFVSPVFSERTVNLSFEQNPRMPFGGQMTFRQVDGPLLSRLLGIFSADMRAWQLTKGTLDGELVLECMRGKRPFAVGNLTFKEIEIHNDEVGVVGAVPLMKVDFAADKNLKTTTQGSVEFIEPAAFSFLGATVPYFEIPQLLGSFHIEGHNGTKVLLEGICGDSETLFNWNLAGNVRLFDEIQTFADLTLSLVEESGEEALVHCLYKKIDGKWEGADLDIKNIGKKQFRFAQQAIAQLSDKWNILDLEKGTFDAQGHLFINDSVIQELKINQLVARDVTINYHPWDISLGVQNLEGTVSVNLHSQDPFRTLNAHLNAENGMIKLNGPEGNHWQLTHLATKIAVNNGILQQSIMEGAFAGMRGTATLDWQEEAVAMHLNFEGMPHGLLPMLPILIRKGFQSEFLDDRMGLTAEVVAKKGGFHVDGRMVVEDQYMRSNERINFQFDLERAHQNFLTIPSKEKENARTTLTGMLPSAALPGMVAMEGWLLQERGIEGYLIRNGTFSAKEIPLAKYVAPFAFTAEDGTKELNIEGKANFQGQFDHMALSMEYTGDNIILEGEDFILNTGTDLEDTTQRPLATYHLNFATLEHCGVLPVRLGTYLDKNRGLLFTDVSTNMKMKDEHIHAVDVECFCLGAYFRGDIDVDLSLPGKGVLDVAVNIETMQAKVSQMSALLSSFDKVPAIAHVPMEGNITQRGGGGKVLFNIRPEKTEMHSKFQAQLSNGTMALAPLDLSLQELFFNIDFDHDANRMEMSDLQGVVLIGKPDRVEEYTLSGEKCCFTDYSNNIGTFDLWIGDRSRDILRLVGNTKGINEEGGDEYIILSLDSLNTHFGDVHPEKFYLSIKNWEEVSKFNLSFDLHLSTLWHDLKVLNRSGVFFFPATVQTRVNELKETRGDFHFDFNFDDSTSLFTYDAVGKDISIGTLKFADCRLNGKIKDDRWMIDQFKLDEMQLAAELVRSEKEWGINFLGLQYGKSLLVGLEGAYVEGNTFMDGKINLFQLDLFHAAEWPFLQDKIEEYQPKGELRANGTFRLATALNDRGWRADISLNSALKGWGIKDAEFIDADDFSCHYVSDRGLTIRHFSSGLSFENSPEKIGQFHVERLDYDFLTTDWTLENFKFAIPSNQVNKTKNFFNLFVENEQTPSSEPSLAITSPERIIGVANGHYSPEQLRLSVALEDGTYIINDVTHRVKNLILSYDPVHFNMQGRYSIERHWPLFSLTTPSSSFERGYIALSDEEESTNGLSIHWKILPKKGFVIDDAVGTLCGITANLVRNPKMEVDEEWHHLEGNVTCQLPEALPLLSPDVAEKIIEQEMGGIYAFKGQWAFARNEERSGGSCFAGNIDAKECKAKGYLFSSFKGEASYAPQEAAIHNITIADEAGIIDIDTLTMKKDAKQQWNFAIPTVQIKNFRPSLLRETSRPLPPPRNSLILSAIEIEDVKGILSETLTWKGNGNFTFANPPKSSLQNTIFAIPAEIITRIGLNPAVLTPIEGAVQFEIEEGKILFKKFKDVYSDSRASKFYLPNSTTPSFLDFEGNLNIQVRMKQYNLLFKIAELFTVTVKGNLEKPVYTLRKQDKKAKMETN